MEVGEEYMEVHEETAWCKEPLKKPQMGDLEVPQWNKTEGENCVKF